MPQVTVNDCAYIDARLRLAGQLLRINHERLGWRLLQVWSQVTARQSLIVASALVAAAIGKKDADDVARAFIDAQIAEPVGADADLLDLSPMQTMFGECDWSQPSSTTSERRETRATAPEPTPAPTPKVTRAQDQAPSLPTNDDVELVPRDMHRLQDEWPHCIHEPYTLYYWILSNGETVKDAREAHVCSHGPTSDDNPCMGCKLKGVRVQKPEKHAEMAAQHYHSLHEGQEIDWPLNIATQMRIGRFIDSVHENTVKHEYVAEHDIHLFNSKIRTNTRKERNDELTRLARSVGK